jgi:death on curing protein
MIAWITRPLALAIHARQLAEHGGDDGLRDPALLDAVLARPRQLLARAVAPPDLADLAACVAAGLVRERPFAAGNAGTAHLCYCVFLALNEVRFEAPDAEKYAAMRGLAEGHLDAGQFAAWLRPHLRAGVHPQVHEAAHAYPKVRGGTPAAARKISTWPVDWQPG